MNRPSCYNRADYKKDLYVQLGWGRDGRRIMGWIPHTMSTDCKQWGPLGEAKLKGWNCDGCRHKPKEIQDERPSNSDS